MPRMDAQEKKWQIENDARTITRNAEVMADSERYNAARKYLEEEQKRVQKTLTAMDVAKQTFKQTGML